MFLHPSCDNLPQVKHDKEAYFQIAEPKLIEWSGDQGNLYQSFGSGVFALNRGLTERVSVAEMHSYESLSGLNSSEHYAPAMFQKKKIVQSIYESDYRFVQEPEMPTLKATPGDGHAASEKAAFQMVIDELDKRSPFKVTDLEVNGHDIMKELGIEEGTLVGTILNALLDQVIDERVDNKHGELIDEARRIHTATSTALAVRT